MTAERPTQLPNSPYTGVGPTTKEWIQDNQTHKKWVARKYGDFFPHIPQHERENRVHREIKNVMHRSGPNGLAHKVISDFLNAAHDVGQVPDSHETVFVPAGGTEAMITSLFNTAKQRVIVAKFGSFGKMWHDNLEQLKKAGIEVVVLGNDNFASGEQPDIAAELESRGIRPNKNDVLVTVGNETSTGIRLNAANQQAMRTFPGIRILDTVSLFLCDKIDYSIADIVGTSMQKGGGGPAALGLLFVNQKAKDHIASFKPNFPIPTMMQLAEDIPNEGQKINNRRIINEGRFHRKDRPGVNIPNTVGLDQFSKATYALEKVHQRGGLDAAAKRSQANHAAWSQFVTGEGANNFNFLVGNPEERSRTTFVMKIVDPTFTEIGDDATKAKIISTMQGILGNEGVRSDDGRLVQKGLGAVINCGMYPGTGFGVRVWTGPMANATDIPQQAAWINWGYEQARDLVLGKSTNVQPVVGNHTAAHARRTLANIGRSNSSPNLFGN